MRTFPTSLSRIRSLLLEQRTRELKALSIEILNLAKQAKEWLRI